MQAASIPSSPQSRARPLTMHLSPQDQLVFDTSEANHSSSSLIAPPEADGVSLNSFQTMETYEQQNIADPMAEVVGEPQGVVKYLCDLDSGLGLILERVKQDAQSCKEAALFLRKRATIEEEYGRSIIKLAKSCQESYQVNETKQGTYGENWMSMMRFHEAIGENRIKFAAAINEISEELTTHFKETEKNRKNLKDIGQKHEKNIHEAEQALEKAKLKYESQSEEWERKILEKNGDSVPISKRSLSKAIFSNKPKSPNQLVKMEEEARGKAAVANENYKSQLSNANSARHEYYNVHLPRMALKDTADECDAALQYHLTRYSYLYEHAMVSDALVISPVKPEDGPSLRKIVEQIDNTADFQTFIVSYGAKAKKVKRRDHTYEEYTLSPHVQDIVNPRTIFGIDLAEQMERDRHDLPVILLKCTKAIEEHGLQSQGIYRLSGAQSQIQKLKALFDRNAEAVDLNTEEFLSDINNIAGVLKLWFRELPNPLFPFNMYYDFIQAAKIEDSNRRVIALHERVNLLPDSNYSTLNYLMGHLDKVVANQQCNKMSVQNLGIVFGPTLMGVPIQNVLSPPPPISQSIAETGGGLNDMGWQCKVIETILENYRVIFVPE